MLTQAIDFQVRKHVAHKPTSRVQFLVKQFKLQATETLNIWQALIPRSVITLVSPQLNAIERYLGLGIGVMMILSLLMSSVIAMKSFMIANYWKEEDAKVSLTSLWLLAQFCVHITLLR